MCLQVPKTNLSHFCSQTCIDKVEKLGSTILEVPSGHITFKSGKQSPGINTILSANIKQWLINSSLRGAIIQRVLPSAEFIKYVFLRLPSLHTTPIGKIELHSWIRRVRSHNSNTRSSVEVRGQFVSQGRSAGNENRRWHGTRRECHLGDKGNTQLCASPTCSLCSIVKNSYDLSLFGKKTGWGR
jgi:hypothetical protein